MALTSDYGAVTAECPYCGQNIDYRRDPNHDCRTNKPPSVWACGGGVQSAAIAALICCGELPKPDIAVIADTEREKATTWEYMNAVLVPNLEKAGVILHRVPKSQYAKEDLWAIGEDADGTHKVLMPMFTNQSGTIGKLPLYCSSKWKARVCGRFIRAMFGLKKWVTWLGMSLDETSRLRVKGEDGPNHYPLCFDNPGKPMRRAGCVEYVASMGWPPAPRSACYQCPNQQDEEWLDMKVNHSGDFAKAVAVDYEVREQDTNAFLHYSCVPLDRVDFAGLIAAKKLTGQTAMFGCESGYCFV